MPFSESPPLGMWLVVLTYLTYPGAGKTGATPSPPSLTGKPWLFGANIHDCHFLSQIVFS